MKLLLTIATLLALHISAYAQEAITEGLWIGEEKSSKVQFYQKGDKLHGKIVWMQNGDDKRDANNPDAALQQRKLVGSDILTGLSRKSDGKWVDGKVYDPNSGKTYSANITMKDNNTVELRGYVGTPMFGGTHTFTRIR